MHGKAGDEARFAVGWSPALVDAVNRRTRQVSLGALKPATRGRVQNQCRQAEVTALAADHRLSTSSGLGVSYFCSLSGVTSGEVTEGLRARRKPLLALR
jgi:hypothetical protein